MSIDPLDLERVRDLRGRDIELWARRFCIVLLAAVPVLALLNVFGQEASQASASSSVATLTVHSPQRVRGGLLFEARFTVRAHQDIKQATLALGSGWADGLTINTIEPSPSQETSSHGELTLQLGQMQAGQTFVLHMQFQVNPTTVDSRKQSVALMDGSTTLLSLTRNFTVLP